MMHGGQRQRMLRLLPRCCSGRAFFRVFAFHILLFQFLASIAWSNGDWFVASITLLTHAALSLLAQWAAIWTQRSPGRLPLLQSVLRSCKAGSNLRNERMGPRCRMEGRGRGRSRASIMFANVCTHFPLKRCRMHTLEVPRDAGSITACTVKLLVLHTCQQSKVYSCRSPAPIARSCNISPLKQRRANPWHVPCAEKHLRLWGNPLWGRNVPGLLTWAAINAGLWVCFVWWIAGLTKLVWIIGASAYTGVILFHGIISIRPGYAHMPAARIIGCLLSSELIEHEIDEGGGRSV